MQKRQKLILFAILEKIESFAACGDTVRSSAFVQDQIIIIVIV